MREPQAVDFLIEQFGFKPSHFRNVTGRVYRAVLCGPKVKDFLLLVRSYLKIKRDQADVAIDYFAACPKCRGRQKLSSDALILRQSFAQVLKDMKKPNPGLESHYG